MACRPSSDADAASHLFYVTAAEFQHRSEWQLNDTYSNEPVISCQLLKVLKWKILNGTSSDGTVIQLQDQMIHINNVIYI